jgi:hypothetical protein
MNSWFHKSGELLASQAFHAVTQRAKILQLLKPMWTEWGQWTGKGLNTCSVSTTYSNSHTKLKDCFCWIWTHPVTGDSWRSRSNLRAVNALKTTRAFRSQQPLSTGHQASKLHSICCLLSSHPPFHQLRPVQLPPRLLLHQQYFCVDLSVPK